MRFRRLIKSMLMRGALPRFVSATRHAAVGQRLQRRSQGIQRRVNGLNRRALVLNRHAQIRQGIAHRSLRTAFTRAAVASLR